MQYKWTAFSVTSIGSLMSALDSTIVLLALLPIAQDIKSDYVTIVWVVIAYLLVNTALVLSLGRFADMYGRKKMYNVGFVIFTIGSVISGLSTNGVMLIGFRAVQGVGAALLTANSFAILSEAFPARERGKAFGAGAIVWGTGSILGIILGGVIISYTTWRWVFLINLPVGVFGTVWAYLALKELNPTVKKESFDIPAALSFTGGLIVFLVGITWGLLNSWSNPVTYISFALTPILFLFFIIFELRYSKSPIMNLTLFKNRIFAFSIMAALLQSLALFSVNFLLIFYLEGIGGFPVLTASYLVVPTALATGIVGPFAGRLSDRIGARTVASAGLAVQAAAILLLSQLNTSTPLLNIALIETLYGAGGGLFWPANTSTIMSSSPMGNYGVVSGIMNTFRNTGMVLSFAISLTAATSVIPTQLVYSLFIGTFNGKLAPQYASAYLSGQSFAFEISTALLLLAIIFSVSRGKIQYHQQPATTKRGATPPFSSE